MEYKYSIIIPHYNIPTLLRRCLKSIPQNDDIQIIVIDDCSNKESIAQLKEIESQHSQIQFVYQDKNLGGGAARNKGLSQAKGKFILFADADDFFNYCIEDILQQYKDCDADLIFFNVNAIDNNLYTHSYRCSHINKIFNLYKKNPKQAEFQLRYSYGEPWGKIYRKDFIVQNRIQFEEIKIHNDTQFSYLTGFYAKKIIVDQRALCCITYRQNSVSKQISTDRIITRVSVFSKQHQFLKQHQIDYLDERIFLSFDFCKKHNLKEELQTCYKTAKEFGLSKTKLNKYRRQIKTKKKLAFIVQVLSKIKKGL